MNKRQWASLGAVGLLLIAGGAAWAFFARAGAREQEGSTTTHKVKKVAEGPGMWDALRKRPLALPKVSAGERCPVTRTANVLPGLGLYLPGDGPIYPEIDTENIPYRLDKAAVRDGWYLYKIGWVASPAYHGPALMRGHQLDGPNEVAFGQSQNPSWELQAENNEGNVAGLPEGWRIIGSPMLLKAPGCYAWQIDGLDFRTVIIFKAEW